MAKIKKNLDCDQLSPKISVGEAYREFLRSRISLCAVATVDIYKYQESQIAVPLSRLADSMEDVSANDIRELLADFRSGHNDGGVWRLYSSIRAFFNWYWLEYDVSKPNPIAKVKCKRPAIAPIQGISRDQISLILQAIQKKSQFPERDKAIISILADTGLRRTSICNLKMKDVDVEKCTLLVFEKDQQFHTKPFGSETQKALRKYLHRLEDILPDDSFWLNLDGSPMRIDGIRQMLQRMEDAAGVPRFQFHAFRRFYGLELYKSTHDIFFVSRALDHKSVEVTKRYLAIQDTEDAEAIRAFSPMDKKNSL